MTYRIIVYTTCATLRVREYLYNSESSIHYYLKAVPMSSNGTQITLKTSETTYLWSQITIMVTKTMSDKKPTFREITGFSVFESDLDLET